jgi:hypothetical protein
MSEGRVRCILEGVGGVDRGGCVVDSAVRCV